MEIITINYPNGYMTINLDTFFPTSQSNFKKLLKVIEMDWQNRDGHIRLIKQWVEDEIKDCESLAKEYANRYVDIRPKVREAEKRMQEIEYTLDILKQTAPAYTSFKDEFNKRKKEYQKLKSLERSYNSSFKHYHNRKEKLQRNLGVLQ